MRLKLGIVWVLLIVAASCGREAVQPADEGNIRLIIDADPVLYNEAGKEISETLYGIFLEDINHALDGGLYAELLKNRSFEFGEAADKGNYHGWNVSDTETVDFTVFYDNRPIGTDISPEDNAFPLNQYNLHYARISRDGATNWGGIGNRGFLKGLAVEEGKEYNLSVYLRSASTPVVRVQLRNGSGDIFAEEYLNGITDEWQKFNCVLIPTATVTSNLRLYIEIMEGILEMDMVSLMPVERFKDTVIRKDIGEYLEALNPGFIRFPGGCVVEGSSLETMYSWKDSIGNGHGWENGGQIKVGDIAVRPQGRSIWSGNGTDPYYTTHGFGFYEFFLLCELLESEPIPVLNAGMTCEIQSCNYLVHDMDSPEFKQAVQDALDLVEFCRGEPDRGWGKVRADMGHEAPFHLKYIGIGNEQWQNEYFAHYRAFIEAFDQAASQRPELFAGIELIVANGAVSGDRMGWDYVARNPDQWTTLVDEHYYEMPEWFFTNTTRYDSYDRNAGAKVFLGEYAARANTLEAALAEAAFMTGLERNADIVKLACYAPLIANSRANQWTPDLIWYDQLSVYGSVNYHVQKMFAGNLGDRLLQSELELPPADNNAVLSGRVGLATWQTKAAFANLRVVDNKTGELLYQNALNDITAFKNDFTDHEGSWSIENDRLVQSHTGNPHDGNTGDAVYVGDFDWTNYTMTVEAEILGGREGFLIPVCVKNSSNMIFWNIGGWGNTISCLQTVSAGQKSGQVLGTVKNIRLNPNEVYEITVVIEGDNIKCYLNDELYIDYTKERPRLMYETVSFDENGDVIIKLVNTSSDRLTIDISISNLDLSNYQEAVITTLAADDLSDNNSFGQPDKITPVIETVDMEKALVYDAPPYSVSIVRLVRV